MFQRPIPAVAPRISPARSAVKSPAKSRLVYTLGAHMSFEGPIELSFHSLGIRRHVFCITSHHPMEFRSNRVKSGSALPALQRKGQASGIRFRLVKCLGSRSVRSDVGDAYVLARAPRLFTLLSFACRCCIQSLFIPLIAKPANLCVFRLSRTIQRSG